MGRRDTPQELPETALMFMRELKALAYRSLGCRYDVRFKLNARGQYVVAVIWANDQTLPMEPSTEHAIRNMGMAKK